MSTETERAKERLDALAIIERLESVAHIGDDVLKAGMVAIQRLIDRDVLRDREPAGQVEAGVSFTDEERQFITDAIDAYREAELAHDDEGHFGAWEENMSRSLAVKLRLAHEATIPQDPGVPFCIERKASGVTEHLTFLEWARMVIGDEYAAARVAHVMLTADDTSKGYPCVHKGASEEREEYVVLDPDALRAQMHDWATLREQA